VIEVCWLSSHFILFSKEKTCQNKKGSLPRSSKPAAQHIYGQMIDWCCVYYFVRNSRVSLLEALCARIISLDSWISVFPDIFFCFFFGVCARTLTKPFLRPSQPGSCAWLSPFLLCADWPWVYSGYLSLIFSCGAMLWSPTLLARQLHQERTQVVCSKEVRKGTEGTGTRPDYLANRADKKNEGPLEEKIAQKSRNSRRVSGGGVGAQGLLTRGSNGLSPRTKNKRSAQRMSLLSLVLRSAWTPWDAVVEACRAVSNGESRYPPGTNRTALP